MRTRKIIGDQQQKSDSDWKLFIVRGTNVTAVQCSLPAVIIGRERENGGIDLGLGLWKQDAMEG